MQRLLWLLGFCVGCFGVLLSFVKLWSLKTSRPRVKHPGSSPSFPFILHQEYLNGSRITTKSSHFYNDHLILLMETFLRWLERIFFLMKDSGSWSIHSYVDISYTFPPAWDTWNMSKGEKVNLLRQNLNCCFFTVSNKTAFTFNTPLVKVFGT